MESYTRVFQISGIKIREKKRVLVQGIQQLGGKYIGGSVYQHTCTHVIIPQVLSSEKFLAACAAGKWVVMPDYVLDSVKNGSWLPEEPYEVAISTGSTSAFYPVRQWREKVATGRLTGAFQGWRVLLMVQEPTRRAMFKRLLKAGRAKVYRFPPPAHVSVTHVMAKPITENLKSHGAPCYPVSHIVQHLFGSNCVDMKFNIIDNHPAETEKTGFVDVDFSKLETELRDYVIKQEGRSRPCFLEFLGYHAPHHPHLQATETDFSNAHTMIECGLFSEALDSIRSDVFPGLLPPVQYLISVLEYAQQGNATSVFLRNLKHFMHTLLFTNPPWLAPSKVKKYYAQLLQCPRCKTGLWPFLETAIRYCLSSEVTCHPLPGPALPTLLHFHCDILAFVLKLFQGELYSISAGDFVALQETGVSKTSGSGSLLKGTFWTVWEHSTLLSHAVKQLTQLLVEAAIRDYAKKDEKLSPDLVVTLLDLLSVLVEFWCQQHFKLNQSLVEKGLKDLAEHFAVISQDVSPVVLVELVVRISCARLKLVMADAIFRNLCCQNGFTVGDEPLSLKKMVMSYLPALGHLAQSNGGACSRTVPTSHSCTTQGTSSRTQEKENIPRGLNRVNVAGSVLLQQTDGNGRTALDLVSTTSQREELLHSAQVADSALRNIVIEVLNLPLLEAGSSLLAHLIFSYKKERDLPGHMQPSDETHSLECRLVRALETHSFQKVTLGWTDQRAVRLLEDAEILLELGRESYLGQVPQALRECRGENTQLLMEILEIVKSHGEVLLAYL
uniref:BRCT domain-containing protein n=1 Tax=Monopterus albus TaxID=43700 RepID=A0A3Q3J1A4_MONAL|nr:SMC5-SMC6 complex localization factor protein 1 isoform X2 [Monopterus albus]